MHDPALVRPYSPDTVNAAAYAQMRAFRSPIVSTHETTFFILLALIAIHVAAAVFAELREGGSVVSAMFTGRKVSAREPADAEHAAPVGTVMPAAGASAAAAEFSPTPTSESHR
jgi:cytochrome b